MSVSYNGNVLIADRDFSNMQGYSSPHLGNSFALEARQVVYAGGAIEAGIRMAVAVKEMYGIMCLVGVFVLLLMLLYDVQPVRSTMGRMRPLRKLGRMVKRQLAIA